MQNRCISNTSRATARSVRLAQAIALTLACAATPAAWAQSTPAPEGELEEIVVTGFRASLAESLEIKRTTATAVDTILAEDIADFPDLNLAESLQRIPGVSIARDAGEGRQITVRGLGPQFTRVRINGMEALSTAGGTDATGGTNRSRSFDFNVFASELFNSLSVRKTASAEIEEGSLGATVDLRAARPFDYNGMTFVTSLQGGYNDLSEEFDPRASVLLSNVFADGRLGALVSVAYTERTLRDDGSSTVRWQKGGFTTLAPGYTGPTLSQLNAAFHPRIPRYDMYENEQERLGITGSLQFAPSDSTAINFDALYSKLDGTRIEQFLQAPVFSAAGASGIGDVDVREAEIRTGRQGQTALVYGVFDDVDVRSEQRFDSLTTEFTQFTLDGSHDFGNGLKLTALAGMAESEHDNPKQTTLLFDALNVDGYVYDFRKDDRLPLISYGALDVTAPASWRLTQIRLRPQTADNSFNTFEGNLEYEFSPAADPERRPAVQAVRIRDHRTAALERYDDQPRSRDPGQRRWRAARRLQQRRQPRTAWVRLRAPRCAGWSRTCNRPAGLLNLYDRTSLPDGDPSPRSATTRRSPRTTPADSCSSISTPRSTDCGCAATSASVMCRRTWRQPVIRSLVVRRSRSLPRTTTTTCCRR